MRSTNYWGGSLEIAEDHHPVAGDGMAAEDGRSRNLGSLMMDRCSPSPRSRRRAELDEIQQGWLLGPRDDAARRRKKKYVDLGCVLCSRSLLKWTAWILLTAAVVATLSILVSKYLVNTKPTKTPQPDQYTQALHNALLFFDAQKSGRLPSSNPIKWRGNSGLKDGSTLRDVKGGLVGGYYDAGDNIKFSFPMAFSMTLLSWSALEYQHKYEAVGEYGHVREVIKWGVDYLLRTFNSTATNIDHIYSQVGSATVNSTNPDDHYCWQRPEDMDYPRPVQVTGAGTDLAGEMAAALAAASILFNDDPVYSKKLVNAAAALLRFAGDRQASYSVNNTAVTPFYGSGGYLDEYLWGATWLYFASGNVSYLDLVTDPGGVAAKAPLGIDSLDLGVLSWDNKIPAVQLLLSRYRMFLNPGYPYEDMLKTYHQVLGDTFCSYTRQFHSFNWTRGGLIQLNHGRPQPLQYVVNAAFLSALYSDYLDALGVPGLQCGPSFFHTAALRHFAFSQVNYIMGSNPEKMSYIVGWGSKYPTRVHHRGASIPNNHRKYSCTGGWKWLKSRYRNPNILVGAMVGGPNHFDRFHDVRTNYNYTEPTLAGNAGLVAALVALTQTAGSGVDRNFIFSGVHPLYEGASPPPPPWKPKHG